MAKPGRGLENAHLVLTARDESGALLGLAGTIAFRLPGVRPVTGDASA
ncbi:hypothetical protein [Streptomyces sp. NPDC048272]